jgi:hypothetical protein
MQKRRTAYGSHVSCQSAQNEKDLSRTSQTSIIQSNNRRHLELLLCMKSPVQNFRADRKGRFGVKFPHLVQIEKQTWSPCEIFFLSGWIFVLFSPVKVQSPVNCYFVWLMLYILHKETSSFNFLLKYILFWCLRLNFIDSVS